MPRWVELIIWSVQQTTSKFFLVLSALCALAAVGLAVAVIDLMLPTPLFITMPQTTSRVSMLTTSFLMFVVESVGACLCFWIAGRAKQGKDLFPWI